ncbi:MAG: prepilin-type N-terminal cleavage/methylation domain-containing protein [Candidatus Omnitrophica bacterium]|nr:prepilin-type N-terminal cleavage/methylation domain-containing protein [Candidatus Omnitrophota bacterium]
MPLKQIKGFTLVELLVTVYVLLIGICGILSLFVNSLLSTQSAWDITTATTHAQHILEEMQSINTLSGIQLTDWKQWSQKQNLNTLPNETLKVTYSDPPDDPLDIQVVDQWQREGRAHSITLRTKLTK